MSEPKDRFMNVSFSDYEFLEDGKKSKPWISLSGDDDGNHYIMYPKSEDPFDWEYDLQLIIETGILLISCIMKIENKCSNHFNGSN